MKKLIILTVIAGYLQLAPALAQNRPDTATVNFVQKAAKGGLMEVGQASWLLQRLAAAVFAILAYAWFRTTPKRMNNSKQLPRQKV
jgi:hypothetical protein